MIIILCFYLFLGAHEPKFSFLKVPISPRISALSESIMTLSDEPSAFTYNPSLFSPKTILAINYLFHFEDTGGGEISVRGGNNRFQFGLNLRCFNFTDQMRNIFGEDIGKIYHRYYIFVLGGGITLVRELKLGANMKFASEWIKYSSEFYENVMLFDVGVSYKKDIHKFGFSLLNLSLTLVDFPFSLNIGGSHELRNFTAHWRLYGYLNELKLCCGLEYFPIDIIALRGGVSYRKQIVVTLGTGINYKDFIFNYSLSSTFHLGIGHRIGLNYLL